MSYIIVLKTRDHVSYFSGIDPQEFSFISEREQAELISSLADANEIMKQCRMDLHKDESLEVLEAS